MDEEFNNSPLTPPKEQHASVALAAARPLQSTYLLSLTSNPAQQNPPQAEPQAAASPTAEALPSKPTSALPELREDDLARYWASVASPGATVGDEKAAVVAASAAAPGAGLGRCVDYQGRLVVGVAQLRLGQPIVVAEYSDLLVVGIVILFLAAVVAVEAMEYCSDLYVFFRCLSLPFPSPSFALLSFLPACSLISAHRISA